MHQYGLPYSIKLYNAVSLKELHFKESKNVWQWRCKTYIQTPNLNISGEIDTSKPIGDIGDIGENGENGKNNDINDIFYTLDSKNNALTWFTLSFEDIVLSLALKFRLPRDLIKVIEKHYYCNNKMETWTCLIKSIENKMLNYWSSKIKSFTFLEQIKTGDRINYRLKLEMPSFDGFMNNDIVWKNGITSKRAIMGSQRDLAKHMHHGKNCVCILQFVMQRSYMEGKCSEMICKLEQILLK